MAERWCFAHHEPSTQSVPFSRDIVGLAISVLSDPRSPPDSRLTYVAGLELIYPSDKPNTVLGYRLPGSRIMIDLQERPLKGFEVMIGEGGVRAILPLFEKMNNWIGKPVDRSVDFRGPVRISTDNEILGLSVDFDVMSPWMLYSTSIGPSIDAVVTIVTIVPIDIDIDIDITG
ncbi:hypothetical protein N7516_001639 [Penicillium verrucosum]|uniref:uncharacterized protein n=1 Tax=Penicillium verrucosum TaxID=60171 RepID=UPI0025455117|nr:uncharacterized protein N7516_001639 [Penicillium verrucosum]KAJ5941471.1 hypothetical protein N7516_001639 [Penicillium verrucosum]